MKRFCLMALLLVLSFSLLFLPSVASASSEEIENLKEQLQRMVEEQTLLKQKIEALEKRETENRAKIVEIGQKPVEAGKKDLQAGYDKGFYIKTPDNNFSLKTNFLLQFRYTYMPFDRTVNTNDEDWSNFLVRRARIFFSGNAPNKDWAYYVHLQLEPQSAVNLNDVYVTWKKYPSAQIQFGREKIPYGLHYWQSAGLLNGVERSIFSGESDVDGKEDARKWPGGNANFQTSNEDSVTKFPVGGFNLYRSQGVHVQGDINALGRDGFFQYWAGIYNGRNTKGAANLDSGHLWVGRISLNPFGKYNLAQQGDFDYSMDPKLCFLGSVFYNTDRLSKIRNEADGKEQSVAPYDVKGTGYNLAAIFRYRGFSADAEYGYDRFEQEMSGGNTWDRFAVRFDTGYFIIPKKVEAVARYAYVERMEDNTVEKSMASGLGLVSVNGGTNNAIENNLQEYTVGLNYYLYGQNLKFLADYSYLIRELTPVPGMTIPVEDQRDNRFRTMVQFSF